MKRGTLDWITNLNNLGLEITQGNLNITKINRAISSNDSHI